MSVGIAKLHVPTCVRDRAGQKKYPRIWGCETKLSGATLPSLLTTVNIPQHQQPSSFKKRHTD
jgi:hypothetical protein